jgi:hypothetical protein
MDATAREVLIDLFHSLTQGPLHLRDKEVLPTSIHTAQQPTPRSRVLLEELIVAQLVKKFPAFYETRKLITAFRTARHLSLS